MNYYKAREQDDLPKLLFDLVATSEEQLEELGLDTDPLVVSEEQFTNPAALGYISYDYGICHFRIFNGELQDRPNVEITAQESAYTDAVNAMKAAEWQRDLEKKTFSFQGREFPMNAGARAVYDAVISQNSVPHTIYSLRGPFTITSGNISDFTTAYRSGILELHAEVLPE